MLSHKNMVPLLGSYVRWTHWLGEWPGRYFGPQLGKISGMLTHLEGLLRHGWVSYPGCIPG
jgi:hypothetical protein